MNKLFDKAITIFWILIFIFLYEKETDDNEA